MCQLGGAHTQVAEELAHHAVRVGGGNLGEARQDENIAVFERRLVHGLKNQRATLSNLKRDVTYKHKGKREHHIALSVSNSSPSPLTSSDEVCH